MCEPCRVTKTQQLPGGRCSVAGALDVVGDRWALLVVREVFFGHHRFSDILRGTGAPRERLSARLSALVDAGVLERRQYSDAPPRAGYHLTASGRDLLPVLQALLHRTERFIAWPAERDLAEYFGQLIGEWVVAVFAHGCRQAFLKPATGFPCPLQAAYVCRPTVSGHRRGRARQSVSRRRGSQREQGAGARS